MIARQDDASFELGRADDQRVALGHVILDELVTKLDGLQVLVQDVRALLGQL